MLNPLKIGASAAGRSADRALFVLGSPLGALQVDEKVHFIYIYNIYFFKMFFLPVYCSILHHCGVGSKPTLVSQGASTSTALMVLLVQKAMGQLSDASWVSGKQNLQPILMPGRKITLFQM